MGYGDISTHDLTKRSTSVALYTNVLFPFQLTTSRRGRRQKCRRVHSKIQKFQLTTSRRGRPGTSPSSANSLLFQLTTSRRGRPTACYRSWYSSYISTHDLTKRSTLAVLPHAQMRWISTHDLTKRSTVYARAIFAVYINFNSRPHEEVDQECGCEITDKDISTHDLTKRSTGKTVCSWRSVDISTHDPTKRPTKATKYTDCKKTFQLTTSRRGRQHMMQLLWKLLNFNSRPHEEVDYR